MHELLFKNKIYHLLFRDENFFSNGIVNKNMPTVKPEIKIYKWVDNKVYFCILDFDRKKVPLIGKNPKFWLINFKKNELLFKKDLEVVDYEKSIVKLLVRSTELLSLKEGTYRFVVTLENQDGTESVLFTDQTFSCSGNLILDTAQIPNPFPSFEETKEGFMPYQIVSPPKTLWCSSAYRTKSDSFQDPGITSFQINLDNWFGTFTILGTHDDTPPNVLENWITIEEYVFSSPYTGVFWDNIIGKFTYLRFVYENNPLNTGEFLKVVAR